MYTSSYILTLLTITHMGMKAKEESTTVSYGCVCLFNNKKTEKKRPPSAFSSHLQDLSIVDVEDNPLNPVTGQDLRVCSPFPGILYSLVIDSALAPSVAALSQYTS